MTKQVKQIPNETASVIIDLLGEEVELPESSQAYGFYSDDRIVGVAVLSKASMPDKYTTTLDLLLFKSGSADKEFISLLLDNLGKRTWDIYAVAAVSSQYGSVLEDSNFIAEDNGYVWRSNSISYYIYRIFSDENPKYYIGRRKLDITDATVEDCLADSYMGSGGAKFQDWIEELKTGHVQKEIISIHKTWKDAVAGEKEAVGELYKSDPNCLNHMPGGIINRANYLNFELRDCDKHGKTLHNGRSCVRCYSLEGSKKAWSIRTCEIHGEVKFRGDVCETCKASTLYSDRECSAHGMTLHRGSTCATCSSEQAVSLRTCPLHGETKHQGAICSTCNSQASVSMKECPQHGLTKHQGDVCNTCNSHKSITEGVCPVHGDVRLQGRSCQKCNAAAQLTVRACAIHGETTHKGKTCALCTSHKSLSMKECATHGLTKHQGSVCNKCNAQQVVNVRVCPTHGETKHQGAVCNKCNSQRSVTIEYCVTHGEAKHQGGKCVACRNAALIQMKECPTHGLHKHRGKTCYGCMADRRRAKTAAAKQNKL